MIDLEFRIIGKLKGELKENLYTMILLLQSRNIWNKRRKNSKEGIANKFSYISMEVRS